MATFPVQANGRYKAIIRGHQGRYLKSKTFTRLSDARTWARRIESDMEAMEALGAEGALLSVTELIGRYRRAKPTNDRSRPGQLRWWEEQIGGLRVRDVTSTIVRQRLVEYAGGDAVRWDGIGPDMKARYRSRGTARKPATVNRMRSALSSVFRWAISEELVHTNPVSRVAQRPEHNRIERYLSEEERVALLIACRHSEWDKLHLLVLMALMTGARRGELLALRWEQIDMVQRTALLLTTKNGDPRVLTLPPPVIEALRPWAEESGLLFPGEKNPASPFNFKRHWLTALRQASIENFRFHDLRHSAASYLAMSGATLLEIGEVLGHRNLETTRRYAHLNVTHRQTLTDNVLGTLSGC